MMSTTSSQEISLSEPHFLLLEMAETREMNGGLGQLKNGRMPKQSRDDRYSDLLTGACLVQNFNSSLKDTKALRILTR